MPPTTDEIDRVLRLGEDSRNEFKSALRGPMESRDIARAIVAFANASGGRLWFGVEPDGSVGGTGDIAARDRLQLRIDEACATGIVPALTCEHHRVEHAGVVLIVTEVPAFAPGRPFRTQDGRHYVRQGASARIATPEELRLLTMSTAASEQAPDELPVAGTASGDIDPVVLGEYHRQLWGEPPPERPDDLAALLRNLRIVSRTGELSLMGTLCFARQPQKQVFHAYVTCAHDAGTEFGAGPTLDRKDVRGTLDQQVRATEEWIMRTLPAPSVVRGFEPEGPVPVLPPLAVREMVRNAVAHRDYSLRGQILITVLDDRLEIVSPGRLLNTLTIAAIRTGAVHMERNPLVCSVLAGWKLMTERGSGVRRAREAMAARGLPEPEFEIRGPSFVVTLRWRSGAS